MLSPSARPALEAIGVDPARLDRDHLACAGIRSAWGEAELRNGNFLRNPYGHGWVLDRGAFEDGLRAHAADLGVESRPGCTVRAVARSGAGWRHDLADGGACRAGALVDCTGRGARVARLAGARWEGGDALIGFTAVFATAPARNPGPARLVLEAAESGWWYTVAVAPGRRVAAFLTDPDLPAAHAAARHAGFARMLSATVHVGAVLAEAQARWEHGPAGWAAGDGWLAAGDAALARDPLSGCGIERAIAGGAAAARAADGWLSGDRAALAAHRAEIDAAHAAYLETRAAVYAREGRWRWSPFWARRHVAAPAIGA